MSPRSTRRAVSLRTPALAGGVVLAGAAAVALTLSGPKAPPAFVVPEAAVTPSGARPTGPAPSTAAAVTPPQPAPVTIASSPAESRGTVAVVLGDGLSASTTAFACAAAAAKGWTCSVFAGAGSGYLSTGTAGSYADQLAKAVSLDAVGLVVVSGGGVDRAASPAQARQAAQALVARVVFGFPQATVLLVPPFDTGSGSTPATTAVRDALRAAADGGDVRFVDASMWFRDTPKVIADGGASLTPEAARTAERRLEAAVPAAVG